MQIFRHIVHVGNDVGVFWGFFSYSEGLQSNPLLLNMQYKTTILSTHILLTVSWTPAFFCMNYITALLTVTLSDIWLGRMQQQSVPVQDLMLGD